jgi:Beta propeller domain
MQRTKLLVGVALLAVVAAGCSDDGDSTAGPSARRLDDIVLASALRRFDSCDAVEAWARDELAPRVGAYGFDGGAYGPLPATTAAEDLARSAGADASVQKQESAASAPAAGAGFSGTNVQVEGVDEPDIVKTDGARIVSVVEGRLVLTSTERGAVVATVNLPDGMYDAKLLLAGDHVLVFGSDWAEGPLPVEDAGPTERAIAAPGISGTRVAEFAIDGDNLVAGDTYVLDGSYISARMTGDIARIVVHADPQQQLPFVTPVVPSEAALAQAEATNRDVVARASGDDLLPHWRRLDAKGEVAEEGTLVDCADAHAPNTFSGFGMVTVVGIDLSDGLRAGIASHAAAGVMASGQTVYSSADHLYVAAPEWVDWQDLDEEQMTAQAEDHGTDIHRFDISDPTAIRYEVSGRVDGAVLDQFAMDEHDGNLRVATTTGAPWSGPEATSESHVVVLAPRDGALVEIGGIGGLGRGETIHSVRFIDAVGYVVTFRQTDPLYTIDLSDPAQPRVAGELKILGYSAYLHPLGNGKLLGIGQDATEEGRQLGTQVALFDVSDPAHPTRVAQTTLPGSSSNAEWDHHAFLWWAASGLAAIPVSAWDPQPFEGLVGFTVDPAAGTIAERGRVTHPELTAEPGVAGKPSDTGVGSTGSDDGPVPLPEPAPFPAGLHPQILRAFVIGDQLWTLSNFGLESSGLESLATGTFVAFPTR